MVCRLVLPILLMHFGASGARALEPELDKPYRLQIVLHIAENRFLTPLFQSQLERSLRDRLQAALGPLAVVEVVRTHPLLADIEARGLEAGLDGSNKLGDAKAHFVLVDYAAGSYVIQARQYDGLTGQASPVVRTASVTDRSAVADSAAKLVELDFGLVGTVIEADKDVRLAIRGGKLATNLDRWVKPGEVFTISRIAKEGDKVKAQRVSWALLEVLEAPRDGICRCRLWRRYQEDDLKSAAGVLGYRALKITTHSGPAQVRLLDDHSLDPLAGVQVHFLRPSDNHKTEVATNREGLAAAREDFKHFAVVRVLAGETTVATLPVVLTADRPVVVRLKGLSEAEAQAPFEFRKDQWVRRVYEDLRLASERVVDLNGLLNKSVEGALAAAKVGLGAMETELKGLAQEREELVRQGAERKIPADRLGLGEGDQRLIELKEKHKELGEFVQRLDNVLREAKSPEALGLAKMLEQARLLEAEADFDRAIALYEKVLAAAPEQAKVRAQLDSLKKAWDPKNARHSEARAFICREWPTLEVRELKANLEKAKEALSVCKDNGDRLTPLKMLQADVGHVANLKKHLEALLRQDSEDSRNQAKVIAQAAEGLARLHAEAAALAERK